MFLGRTDNVTNNFYQYGLNGNIFFRGNSLTTNQNKEINLICLRIT